MPLSKSLALILKIPVFILWMPVFSYSQTVIEGLAQGTSYRVVFYDNTDRIDKDRIDGLLRDIDHSLSIYRPYSLISRFNHPDTMAVKMDEHLEKVVYSSFKHWKWSKGIFDITIGPLTELYGFGKTEKSHKPDPEQIKEARKQVGMKNLIIKNGYLIKKRPGISIDVNGIAQGYSVDVLAEYLESQGIENYLVEIGGEIRSKGTHPDGRNFKVALEINDEYQMFELYNQSVTTSGTSTGHHINPKKGKPLKTTISSATVFSQFAIDADAIDNYIISMKPSKAKKWAKQKGIEVVLILKEQ